MTTKAGKFELTNPTINGLSSLAPKYKDPTTVVKQSREPINIRSIPEMHFITNKKITLQPQNGILSAALSQRPSH
jgi:hypothetical protein